jgi:hypothetical protein
MLQVQLVFIMQLTYPALVVAAYFNVRCYCLQTALGHRVRVLVFFAR